MTSNELSAIEAPQDVDPVVELASALANTPKRYAKPEGGDVLTYEPPIVLRRCAVEGVLATLDAQREASEKALREREEAVDVGCDALIDRDGLWAELHDLRALLPRIVAVACEMQREADLATSKDRGWDVSALLASRPLVEAGAVMAQLEKSES